jgi:hypothetical protein
LALAYLWLADIVVAIHAACAACVLGGFVAILLGWIVPGPGSGTSRSVSATCFAPL